MDTPTLDTLILQLPEFDDRTAFLALKRLEGSMKFRIHTEGKNANGGLMGTFSPRTLGRYSLYYGRRRRRDGRRVDRKDLQFKGNLIRSYTVGTFKNGYALGFTFDRARRIAEGQQFQTRSLIFFPTPAERQEMIEIIADQIL